MGLLCAVLGLFCASGIQPIPTPTKHPVDAVTYPEVTMPMPTMPMPTMPTPEPVEVSAVLLIGCPVDPHFTEWDKFFQGASLIEGTPDACEIKAQCKAESQFDRFARSPAGAEGPMQFLESTASDVGLEDPTDPRDSIRAGARYMKWQMGQWMRYGRTYEQIWKLALAAYNFGLGNLLKIQARHGGIYYEDFEPYLPQETRKYVERIWTLVQSGEWV